VARGRLFSIYSIQTDILQKALANRAAFQRIFIASQRIFSHWRLGEKWVMVMNVWVLLLSLFWFWSAPTLARRRGLPVLLKPTNRGCSLEARH
jgi:hypothetical protein